MFAEIFQHVPRWVWILLAALIAIGISQSFPRRRSIRSATLFPVAMIGLSFYGVVSVFPYQAGALAAWLAGVAAAVMASMAIGVWSDIRWSDADERLLVPGSWVPLMLILGIFIVKFGVGVALAMHAELARDTLFAALISLAYGAFSGVFFARGLAMWRVARNALQLRLAA
ncbi:MAG: hypothetical protein HYS18_16910 [Burkholderiales bacterium]|nr:hypothetical protein [Burkholderiales bacterium]